MSYIKQKENSVIHLPPLAPPGWKKWVKVRRKCRDDWVEHCQYYVHKATLSADPASDANDCTVVVIYEERLRLAFIRLGKDTKWTYVDERVSTSVGANVIHGCCGLQDVAQVEDEFYTVNYASEVFSFKVTPRSSTDMKVAARGFKKGVTMNKYLVEANDNVTLMVHRYLQLDYQACKRVTIKFTIFELNLEKCEWVEKQSLGDATLFIGNNSSVSVLASKFPACQPNCIYFNHDRSRVDCEFPAHDFGVYNVVNQSFLDPYTTHVKTMWSMTDRLPIWVMPTIRL